MAFKTLRHERIQDESGAAKTGHYLSHAFGRADAETLKAPASEKAHRALSSFETFLDVKWLPHAQLFVFAAAHVVVVEVAAGAAGKVLGQITISEVYTAQRPGSPNHRICVVEGTEGAAAAVQTNLIADRAVNYHHTRPPPAR